MLRAGEGRQKTACVVGSTLTFVRSRDAKSSTGLPGVVSLPALDDSQASVGSTTAPSSAALLEQNLEVRALVGQAFEAFVPKPAPSELEGIDRGQPTHTILTRPREDVSGPLASAANLRAAFPMHRAEIDHHPPVRRRPEPIAKNHLTIKESGGKVLLLEVLGPAKVRVSLGKRTDYERGTPLSRELGPGDAQFLGELGRWVKRKVVDDPQGPEIYGPLNALLRVTSPEAEALSDRFARVEALGRAISQLSAEDQRRVISSSDSSERSLAQHFEEFMRRALGHVDGDRSADPLRGPSDDPAVLYFGEYNYRGHSGGLAVWRDDAYIQGYYHRRLQEEPGQNLWQRVFEEQPMLAWNEGAGHFELKRGAEVQARLLAELTKDAGSEGLALYRGMSNFEGALYALSAALKDGPAPPNWRDTLTKGLHELREDLAFQERWARDSGSVEQAEAITQRQAALALYSAKLPEEMKAVRDPEALRGFLRAQLLQTVTGSSYGAYFLTPSSGYANRFGGGQVAEFQLKKELLESLSAKKQAYVGVERSVEIGLLAGPGQLDPGALVDLLIQGYVASQPTQPDY